MIVFSTFAAVLELKQSQEQSNDFTNDLLSRTPPFRMNFHNERRVKVETYCRIYPCIRRWWNRWRCFGDFMLGIFSLMLTVQTNGRSNERAPSD